MDSPLTVYKLTILYILDRAAGEVAADRVSGFLLENGYVNFVSLMQTYAELEEAGLIRPGRKGERIMLSLTGEGRETLRFFSSRLGAEIKDQAEDWLRAQKIEILEDRQFTAEYDRHPDGGYVVRLAVRERRTPVLDMTLSVPDKAAAEEAVRGWKEKSGEIYSLIIEKLF
jgi:hypothetical protein